MRGWWLVIFFAACGHEDAVLHIDVVVRTSGVTVYAHDPNRDACGNTFPEPGRCGGFTDASECPSPPDTAIGTVRIERGGDVLDETAIDDAAFLQVPDIAGHDGFELVLVGDGSEDRVAMPAVVAPVPAITDVTATSDEVDVTWTSEPAAETALVVVSTGFVATLCHVSAAQQPAAVAWPGGPDFLSVSVQSFAPASLADSLFGDVRFWYGETVTQPGSQ